MSWPVTFFDVYHYLIGEVEFAVVDIETTGGIVRRNRIIEISIFVFDGSKIMDRYTTFINPQKTIPASIIGLTGITNEMVSSAPCFKDVADIIQNLTKDRIFVAHNVGFDYSFLRDEFKAIGRTFFRPKLCTVRLSREIFPGLRSYGLGNLCQHLDIVIENRHRAEGDARATVRVLKKLLLSDHEDFVGKSLNRNSRESTLPPNLPKSEFDQLPEETGVYYFLNQKNEPLYIGKANNIRNRVLSHFTGSSKRKQELVRQMHHIGFELTGDELIALLLESHEIKHKSPKYNRAQIRRYPTYGIYEYEDSKGYLRMSLAQVSKIKRPLIAFSNFQQGWDFLQSKISEFNLCPKLAGVQTQPGACSHFKVQMCRGGCVEAESSTDYNARVKDALDTFGDTNKSFLLLGNGRSFDELSIVAVEEGRYLGFGYVHDSIQDTSVESLRRCITSYDDNYDTQRIIDGYLRRHPKARKIKY